MELVEFTRRIVSTYADVEECAKDYNVDSTLLRNILHTRDELSPDMISIVSIILGQPLG